MSPSSRRYGQYCPVARLLDVLGERWTLLIVRNLMMGPQRYTDLRDGLPGIATDLLTARLRALEEAGYVRRRRLPRPAPATVYELTDAGRGLAPVILDLARAGLRELGPPGAGDDVGADALVLSLNASFRGDAGAREEDYELELDGEPFAIAIRDGAVETARGPAAGPGLRIATSARTFAELLSGAIEPGAAIDAGELRLDGPRSALERFLAVFSYPAAREAVATP